MDTPDRLPLNDANAFPINFAGKQLTTHEMIERTDLLMKQLGWTNEKGRTYLRKTYGKRSRYLLSDEEFWQFLQHLENQAAYPQSNSPVSEQLDYLAIFQKIDFLMQKLRWTNEEECAYLIKTYGQRSRHFLNDEELLQFLQYLENQAAYPQSNSPVSKQLDRHEMIEKTELLDDAVVAPPKSPVSEQLDPHEIIERTDLLMKRLGWTTEEGRAYLKETYGKRSRHLLNEEELLEFLQYLENQTR